MAVFVVAPAYGHHILYYTHLMPNAKEGCHVSLSKLLSVSGSRRMKYTESSFSACGPLNSYKRRMLICPRASFTFETQAQLFSEFGQNIVRVFQTEAAVPAKLVAESVSGKSQTDSALEGILQYIPAISIEVSVAAVALLVGTFMGYIVAGNAQKEEYGDAEPAAKWLLMMNSTPFNRFVLMRCPSIKFKDIDIYNGLSKKLTTEGHHVVRLCNNSLGTSDQKENGACYSSKDGDWTGHVLRIASDNQKSSQQQVRKNTKLEERAPTCYQRTFLHADDGGVLAVDWPSDLELSGEHGLDTTFLLVPGSSDGSRDVIIQEFVQSCVRYGYFPIVLNPRGCGGSPLTTPRLFTAGDSDDVRMAVEFVLKSRPWAAIMAVGWGYGADMLVKYLGEEAASTPVTGAVCIENTFDLEEANKLSQDGHVDLFDQKMANGFVQILKSNQMVFEGKGRDFDVQKGLSAKTVRDFDEAISTFSKGYKDVHELYKDSSSKSWIDNVKIPLLCIQDSDSIGKTFSIPRHVFEQNPFMTLLLLLTRKKETFSQTNATGYYDTLVIEWLAAVELAFLKGRHPLLQGIDVFKLPLKERSFGQDGGKAMARKENRIRRGIDRSVNYLPNSNQNSEDFRLWYRDHSSDQDDSRNDIKALARDSQNSRGSQEENSEGGERRPSEKELPDNSDTDDSDDDNSEMEQGQVRQAAESVMKVLDVTMPGTLSQKQKEEVLEAVGRGETLVSALQEACPEDVREKMATAVSAAVQASGISMKLAGFGKKMPAPKIPVGMVEKVQQKLSSLVHDKAPGAPMHEGLTMPDPVLHGSNVDVQNGNQEYVSSQKEGDPKPAQEGASAVPRGKIESGAASEPSSKADSDVQQSINQGTTATKESQDILSLATEKQKGDMGERPAGDDNEPNESDASQAEKQSDSSPQEQQKLSGEEKKQENLVAQSQNNEPQQTDKRTEASTDSSADEQNKKVAEQNAGGVSSTQTPPPIPAASSLPSIDISRAFEALTGVDDSTQMAVTNVFGVIENVLEQLEKEQGQKNEQLEQVPKDGQVEQGKKNEQLEQVPKDGQVEQGRRDDYLEQGKKVEHVEQPSLLLHKSSIDGRDKRQSSLQGDAFRENSGQLRLGLSEGTSGRQCPGKGSDESTEELGKVQKTTTRNFDKQARNNHLPTENSLGSERHSALDKDDEFDDANLALEYSEDENIWKLIDGTSETEGTWVGMNAERWDEHSKVGSSKLDTVSGIEKTEMIDPEYILVDDQVEQPAVHGVFPNRTVQYDDPKPSELLSTSFNSITCPHEHKDTVSHLQRKVQKLVIDALELELLRRLGNSNMRLLGTALERDIEIVGLTVAETAGLKSYQQDYADESVSKESLKEKIGIEEKLHVDTLISAVNEVYETLTVLPSVLPAGVLFGNILAALSPLGIVSTFDMPDGKSIVQNTREGSSSRKSLMLVQTSDDLRFLAKKYDGNDTISSSHFLSNPHENSENIETYGKKEDMDGASWNRDMKFVTGAETCDGDPASDGKPAEADEATSTNNLMGAMAAAMGATLAGHERLHSSENMNEKRDSHVDAAGSASEGNGEQLDNDERKASIVSNLAEKAMSMAAPVVPTNKDGGVDHERLVELLAGLGQKGGILRLVGKVALLWGGLRGAMSLTDRLLGFLHMSDRPLYQRIAGFMMMVLLLWSPVLVPLLPTLLQQWASRSQNGIASTAALIGLYCAVVILINIWGKKIRGFEDPLHQYGINMQPGFNPKQLQSLMSGLTLGLSLVAAIYMLGVSFHLIQLEWAPVLSLNASKTFLWNVFCSWRIFKLMVQCFGISLAVSFVEELFFRSWLQKEISADLGFHKATAISGLAFSLSHRSLPLMPALWLLSLILTGAKVGCNGDLTLAIGIHAGLMAGAQLINMYGQVTYGTSASIWFVSHQSADPFTGLIGLTILGILVLLFYPWAYDEKRET